MWQVTLGVKLPASLFLSFHIIQKREQLTPDQIAWVGCIGSLSSLIPRTWKDVYSGGRRKLSENLPVKKPGPSGEAGGPERRPRKASAPPPPLAPPAGHVVAVFVKKTSRDKSSPTSLTADFTGEDQEVFESSEGEGKRREMVVPLWVLRFKSTGDAASWLSCASEAFAVQLPLFGAIWMVTEQAEIFWASDDSLASTAWNKVSCYDVHVCI